MALYSFGAFEFDSGTGDLRKEGRRVRLRPQPARALEHLLERAGELVSRSDLQRVIWPDGTFVHFDHGLNSCIKQIRAALGDSRSAPCYVETLVRRGFRFIAPVTMVPSEDLPPKPRRRHILVLPVRPLEDGEELAAIAGAEALGEEILVQLTQVSPREVAVVSMAPLEQGAAIEPEVPVDFFLAASIRPTVNRLRVTSKLIDARSLCHVWVGRFYAPLDPPLDAPVSVAQRIVSEVLATLEGDEVAGWSNEGARRSNVPVVGGTRP
jgi:DNA-binding winged helix-turn-helix (wHTH) protein